jgi:hypothetical protein
LWLVARNNLAGRPSRTQQVIVPDRLQLRFLKVVLLVKVVYNQNGFAGPAAGKFSR